MVMDNLVYCPSGDNLASGSPRPGHQHQPTPEFPNSTLDSDPSDGSMRKDEALLFSLQLSTSD